MKVTKREIRKIIREEKARLLREQAEMDPKTADAIQLLQTVNMNLQDIMANTRGPVYDDLNKQLAMLEDAIHALGGVA
tara:strand:+ start:256 stop:489 length:234 start_codon:yes stop_codon:yes gene_type:complete